MRVSCARHRKASYLHHFLARVHYHLNGALDAGDGDGDGDGGLRGELWWTRGGRDSRGAEF